jgi:hypothetical protein
MTKSLLYKYNSMLPKVMSIAFPLMLEQSEG